jgi:uroporphyrinogen decarboxylase
MLSRKRVLASLSHQEPDHIPFDLGGTVITGIHHIAYQNLLSYLGMDTEKLSICDPIQQLAEVDEKMRLKLGIDVCGAWEEQSQGKGFTPQLRENGSKSFADKYGVIWTMPKNGLYYDMTSHPLAGTVNQADINDHSWPDPQNFADVKGLKRRLEQLYNETEHAITISLGEGIMERTQWLRGYEDFFLDLVRNPSLILGILDRVLKIKLEVWDTLLTEIGHLVQVIIEADDLGDQKRSIISPDMYRKYIKPRHRRLFSGIKEKLPHVHIFFHSDGAIHDLIPDLMEAGIDILNPVQVSAAGMDTKRLKKEFGDVLTFWGGGIDTQRVLPRGTPDEVRDEVKKRIDDLAPGGGFVFSTIHNIQADVPPENIMAMWDTLQECGIY